jgi:hypothetical protein
MKYVKSFEAKRQSKISQIKSDDSLVQDKFLSVRFISVKSTLVPDSNSVSSRNRKVWRVGSKTGIYKLI